ncbi:ATP-dependent helicase [Planosporangium thailandense]|uniref:DNA 3'-5' helicase n=1 Tax=Planosporangium thailandense TaxID=765197 RepID=A0ABX0XU69_9ACTN|nr:ATP-dependent helicase [Planosporangium thailandense]
MGAGEAGPATPLADPGQRQVITHVDGPLLVIGGPGTGKTSTLVEAVVARVAEGVAPERVLALSHSRRSALHLRDRVEARLGAVVGRRSLAEPMVRTFPGYAFGLLQRAAALAGDPPPRLLTAAEADLVIRELLDSESEQEAWPEALRPALRTRAFATELRDLLLRAVERGIGPAELAAHARALRRPDWWAAARFYRQYRQVLALRDATGQGSVGYDGAELVRAATSLLLDDPHLLTAERRGVAAVYVDEFADTDPAHRDLLAALAGGGKHLVVFADPDSSTFAFRGADPSGVAEFSDRFRTTAGAEAPTVTLGRSYRCGAELLAASRRVAVRLRGPSRHRVLTPGPSAPPGTVEVRMFRSVTSESAYLVHRLREAHLLHGLAWSDMAVIVRSTVRQLAPLRRALSQAGIPTMTAAEDLPLQAQAAVAPLLLLLRCALAPERLDEEAAVALLHSPLGGADPLAERRLRQGLRALAFAAGDRRPSGVLLVEALREPAVLATTDRRWAVPAKAVADLLDTARRTATRDGATVEDVLWEVWRASGLADRWAAVSAQGGHRGEAADRDLDAVVALFDTAARFVDRLPGARAEAFCDHVLGQDLPGESIAPAAERGPAVRILTAHAAKGLEWEFVAVVGVQEGAWPDLRLRGSVLGSEVLVDLAAGREMTTAGRIAAQLDEERRLFYVAATRARRHLLVTAVAGGDAEEQPSRFLTELADEIRPEVTPPRALTLPALVAELRSAVAAPDAPAARRRAAAAQLARLAAAGVPGAHPDDWWGLPELSDDRPIVDPGEPVTVTPSTVETVQRCSLRWLLERHGGKAASSPEQSIGNLIHAAARLAADATADRAALVDYVAGRFDAIELSARWLAGRERERAEAMLDKLLAWLTSNPRRLIAIERDFLVRLDDDLQIKGRVDRLELDESGRLVVVDLKTGRSAPTEAEVADHPQLAAYQAAIEAGAFGESTEAGGAALVHLGAARSGAKVQGQAALADAEDPGWAREMVSRTAQMMAASTFEAVQNNKCRVCPVRTSCPISGNGRHVTDGDA